jgi:hypothetical protein
LVEFEVQCQNGHPRLAKKTKLPASRVFGYQTTDGFYAEAARVGNTGDLERCVGRTDVRVEPTTRAGYGVDGNGDLRR